MLSWSSIGPCLGMFLPPVRDAHEAAVQIRHALREGNPFSFASRLPEAERKSREQKSIAKLMEVLAFGAYTFANVSYHWDAQKPEVAQRSAEHTPIQIDPFSAVNTPRFAWKGCHFLTLYGFLHHGLKRDRYHTDEEIAFRELFLADRFKRVVNVVEPRFAFVDLFGNAVFKPDRRHVDLRQFAWGVTIYSPEDTRRIGLDALESAPAWRVERLPWGGTWVQLAENPFQVEAKTRLGVQKHLNLKEVFSGKDGPMQLDPAGRLTS